MRVAHLNAQKLMIFLGMPTPTNMLIKLKGNPKLAKTLRSFLNNELDVNLYSLKEALRENWPPTEMVNKDTMEATLKAPPVAIEYIENDSKLIFKLPVNMMSDYFESEKSIAILLIV